MAKATLSLKRLEAILGDILSPELAQDWDNVGLLVGNYQSEIERILLCIDMTDDVLKEAIQKKIQLVLAYHPPIFNPLKNIRLDTQPTIFSAIRNNIAIYSIHTALDVIAGGTSDILADTFELENRKPIDIIDNSKHQFKIVVFVPEDSLDSVAKAMFKAGAGQIGQYSHCSFRLEGIGTFLPSKKANPTIGKPGKATSVKEIRLETLASESNLSQIINAMIKAHPYETPAFDIYPLKKTSEQTIGLGRIGTLKTPAKLTTIISKIKRNTGLKHLFVSDAQNKKIRTAACCPGAGGTLAEQLAGKIDLFVTGEMRHHTALHLARLGTSAICLGHGNSERIALPALRNTLKKDIRLKDIKFFISQKDKDPLKII